MNQDNFFKFQQPVTFRMVENPLDFLLMEGADAQRATRSSIESSDRQLEIPNCDPSFVRSRQDSGRSRQSLNLQEPFAAA